MCSVIITAAGNSTRFGRDKLSAILGGLPLLIRTIYAFQSHSQIDEIILVVASSRLKEMSPLTKSFSKINQIVAGGSSRLESVTAGVLVASEELCLVHNGANPLVSAAEISAVIKAVSDDQAATVGRPVNSTLKEIKNGKITKTLNRAKIYATETPQGFKKDLYLQALKLSSKSNTFTDEMAFLESTGIKSVIVPASPQNIKVTTKFDLAVLESFIKAQTKIGIGHDSHRYQEGEGGITVGGIKIPHSKKFTANSDGDLLVHALCNAIGTAIGEGSLSLYSDDLFQKKGETNSMKYLQHINKKMLASGYLIGNISVSLEGKEPKIEKFIPLIKQNLAEQLQINPLQIGVAATSGEGLTSFGKGEGMQCFVYVQLIRG
jgi:2-C-methyl-D-erythritol 4-phosphate cytidylyltransferase / 2-C-methyl-D-erythritol 2,4-cyclodiphosphate synthase